MAEFVYGPLHSVMIEHRIVSIKHRHRVAYYYMSKGLFNTFMQYLNEGIYLFMHVSETEKRMKVVMAKTVESLDKIMFPDRQNPQVYYDITLIKSGIKTIMNQTKPKLFLDLEMSMPPYHDYEHFVSEIIQCGVVLVNEANEVVLKASNFVLPTLFPELSSRTKKFLHITQEDISQGITYETFYRWLDDLFKKYQPMVVVWGQNDLIEIKKSCQLHHLPDITRHVQFIDLLKLHKHYYRLKNDLGLFNAYNAYATEDLDVQVHDALEDASVTHFIFDQFRSVCNNERRIEIHQ